MKKHSMLYGGLLIILTNVYGLCITFIFRPIAPAMLVSSLYASQSFTLSSTRGESCLIVVKDSLMRLWCLSNSRLEMYFAILSFVSLVFLNYVQNKNGDQWGEINGILVGINTLAITEF